MIRGLSFVFLMLAALPGSVAAETFGGPVSASVVEVIDGDTIAVKAKVWLGVEVSSRVRIRGIDTPELHSSCAAEKTMAEQARQRLAKIAGGTVSLANVVDDKYGGRVDADVANAVGVDLKTAMLATGLAHPYDGKGARADWCPVASTQ
ncbi:MAG: thermonuclease family protein [Bauldia sp.]